MRRIVLLTTLICLFALPAGAVNYFVSPSGNDGSDGLTPGAAWKSPDNGDSKGLLAPGDTIFIEPGTYMPDRSYVFTISGTGDEPIVYLKSGGGAAALMALSGTNAVLQVGGDNLEFHDLDVSCDALATIGGFEISGDSCLITGCQIFGVYHEGIKITGSRNTILRNIVHSCDDDGVAATGSSNRNRIYGNTVYDNDLDGLHFLGSGLNNRLFNNIVVLNGGYGISGSGDDVCGFNDVWNNSGGDYSTSIADSAGGISEDPEFVDGPGGDFNLQSTSPAIDTGLDLGYPYYGSAPDMGALESTGAPPTGRVIWRWESSATPKFSWWDGFSFDTAEDMASAGAWRIIAGAEAPARDEAVVAGVCTDGGITLQVWDGTSWTTSPLNPLATVTQTFWWGCAVAYMQQTGDAVVVWDNASGGTDGLSYRVGNQFGWSDEDTIPLPLAGEPLHMHLAANPNSDEMVLIVSNEFSQDYAIVWDGSGWGNAEVLDSSGVGDDRTDVYTVYEQQSGRALTVYGRGLSSVYYSIWDGAGWSIADELAKPGDASGNVRWTTLASDPGSNRVALAVLTDSDNAWLSVWDGSAWEVPETGTTSMTGTIYPGVAVAFEGQSGEAIATYGEGSQVRYRTWVSGTGWSGELQAAYIGETPNSMMLDAAPGSDQIMLSVQDAGSSLNCVRWDGSSWGAPEEIEANTAEVKNQPFMFLWDRSGPATNQAPELAAIGPRSVDEGENLNFTVSASDPDGTTPMLSAEDVPVNAGFIDNGDGTGTFDFNPDYTQAGVYDVRFIASDGALADSEVVAITVNAAPLAYITIEPDSTVVSADSTIVFTAAGYDAGGEEEDPGSITWGLVDPLGSIDATGLFDPTTVGVTRVTGLSSLGPSDTTSYLEVVPGEASFIDVVPSSQAVIEDSSFQFGALAYDADSNLVSDVTASAEWSTTDPSGTVTAQGIYTAGNNPSPPTYYVRATLHLPLGSLHTVTDSSAVIVIPNGSLHYVRVETADGTEFGDTTLTADNDTTAFFCRGYDSGDALIGDIEATWIVLDDDSVGSVSPGYGASTRLILHRTGSTRLSATYISGKCDTTGVITCTPGWPARLVIAPDTASVAAGDTIQFTLWTFDSDFNPSAPVSPDQWDVLGDIGDISETGLFTATTAGTGLVTCLAEGLRDTTGAVNVLPGPLSRLEISPDSLEIGLGGSFTFTAQGSDAYGNETGTGGLTWDVIGDIGEMDTAGVFTALAVGTGRIAATSSMGGVADTNSVVIVIPSDLDLLVIDPDTASVKISGQVQFSAYGYDAAFEPVDAGPLTWEVLGGIGSIDMSGLFTATAAGVGRIAVASINGTSDTTDMIVVEVPTIDEISIGHRYVHAGDRDIPILSFRITNAFDGRETIESITVRDASRGAGTSQEISSNIDTLKLYMDDDESLNLSPSDVLLSAGLAGDAVRLSFPPVTIGPGADRAFFVSVDISPFPRDGDSLDLYLLPLTDIELAGGTVVAGSDTVNSLGYDIIDGVIAAQVVLVPTGVTAIAPQDGMSNVLTVDVPRNGYSDDILKILSVFSTGSADTADIDSLVLYRDGGGGVWTGPGEEVRLGRLSFTGDQWQISGLAEGLDAQTTRFHVGARISSDASNGRTLALGIPLHGLEMASDNDGPIDRPITPIETITIVAPEMVSVRAIEFEPGEVIPGRNTGPVFGIELSNGYSVPVLLDTLRVESGFEDPGGATQQMLDDQVDAVSLWIDLDGDYAEHGPSDTLVATARIVDGVASFPTTGLVLPPAGGGIGLFLECDMSLTLSKDGNTVGFSVPAPENMDFMSPVSVSGDFPLVTSQPFIMNAFPATAVTAFPVTGTTLFGSQTDRLFLDFVLPRNGYADDQLTALSVVNTGSTAGKGAIATLKLWADSGGDGFSGDDILLGEFSHRDGGVWEIEGLSIPVPEGGRRFMITADVAAYGFEGGTARFEVPRCGALYVSGMDGPDDVSVGNPESHFLFPANRITVIPIPREFATVAPGAPQPQLLTFALYNGYPDETHILRDLRLTNGTRTPSSAAFADFELGQISLYYDRNSSRALDDDSLLATGYFDSGTLNLSGLDVTLAPESLRYFFVTAVIPTDVIDSDTLAVTIEEPSDLDFVETVNINGDFPVSRGGALVIDGSVRCQYEMLGVESRTLAPGDESVPVLAFRPARNGDRLDALDSLVVTNLGDAGLGDISSLRLYIDTNGDDTWQPGDTLVADATHQDGDWLFEDLALMIGADDRALLIVADISATAATYTTIRMAVPVGGCRYASSNDGPLDGALVSAQTFTLSGSVLKVTYDKLAPTYSVGQGIDLKVRVTNLLSTAVPGVTCDVLPADGEDMVHLENAFLGPVELGPSQTVQFYADYTAVQTGETYWRMLAFSSELEETSGVVFTEPVLIQSAPVTVSLEMLSSIPTAVTRGQTRVFPLSIRYRHSDDFPLAAPVRLDSLRIHVEDEYGDPQPADDVFSRLVLATGFTNLAVVDPPLHESTVPVVFTEPVLLSPGLEQVMSLRVDIDSSATAQSFALALDSEADLEFVDCNTGAPVPIDPGVTFPLKTASCRISNPSRHIAVSYVPDLRETVNQGQRNVDVLRLLLRHPGMTDDSQVQFTALSLTFVDSERNPIEASDVFDSIDLVRNQATIGRLGPAEMGPDVLTVRFTAPPVLNPGETDTVKVRVSVRPDSGEPGFGMEVRDSTWLVLRDLTSGALVQAVSDEEAPLLGSVFPMWSGSASLMKPADDPEVCPESKMPASLIAGSDAVAVMGISVCHPGGDGQSSFRLEKARVAVTDSVGVPLDPRLLFDRIGASIGGGPVEYQEFITVEGGYTVFEIGSDGCTVDAGGSTYIELVADLEVETPFDHFVLRMYAQNGFRATDDTDRQRVLGVRVDTECTDGLPFATGPVMIFLPAGAPVVKRYPMGSRIAYPGQTGLEFFQGEIAYRSTGPQADLVLGGIAGETLVRTEHGLSPVSAAEVFDAVYLLIDGVPVAADTVLAGNTVSLVPDDGYLISRDAVKTVTLTCDLPPDAREGNYLVSFEDSSFMKLQDHDLGTDVSAVLVGTAYPLLTADVSVSKEGLSGSFVNWPNPFNPDKEVTTLGFVLPDDARVDIEIFSITGDLVRSLVSDASRPEGPNQEDEWNGENDSGTPVLPGTYFCRIRVEYLSGGSEETVRKVAVIR